MELLCVLAQEVRHGGSSLYRVETAIGRHQVNYSYCVVYKCQRVIQGGLSTTTRGVPVDYEIRRKNAAINPDSGMRCDDDEKNKIVMVSLQVSVNHRNTLTRKKRV